MSHKPYFFIIMVQIYKEYIVFTNFLPRKYNIYIDFNYDLTNTSYMFTEIKKYNIYI